VGLLLGLLFAFSLPGCNPSRKSKPKVEAAPPVESTKYVPLRKGEMLLAALARAGLPEERCRAISDYLPRVGVFNQNCAAGESLVGYFRDDNLYRFEYRQGYDRTHIITFDSNRVRLAGGYHWVRVEPKVYSGVIHSSLWGSMVRIGQKPDMIMRFADLFSWDIDFFTETQSGDSFKFITEELYCDEGPVGRPRLIVGKYKGKAGEYYGYFYEDPSGRRDYYTPKGEAVRKGFLRSPLQFSRISSGFSSGRMHPILRYVRPHQGVDYVARSGTPVSAIGDGLVVQAGWAGGYGRLVELRHPGGYSSRYGHLSRFGKIRNGARVAQGQVIGYVGMTGLATGPHLHFEIRVNGVPQNPLRIIPPRADPVARAYLPTFRARVDSLTRLLNAAPATPEDKSAPEDSSPVVDSAAMDPEHGQAKPPADTGKHARNQ
jgi:murein DD-endopeptidase MepM/ murein hydrolase activator NlpD